MSVSESSLNQNDVLKDAKGLGCIEVFILGDKVLLVYYEPHTTQTLHTLIWGINNATMYE